MRSTKNIITLYSNCSRWESEREEEKDLSKFKAGYVACVNVIEKLHSWSEKDRDIRSEVYINLFISKCQNSSLDHVFRHFWNSGGHINMLKFQNIKINKGIESLPQN